MTRDGVLAAINTEYSDVLNPPAVEEAGKCEEGTKFSIGLIVAAILLLCLYTGLILISDSEACMSYIRRTMGWPEPEDESLGESDETPESNTSDNSKPKPKKDHVVSAPPLPSPTSPRTAGPQCAPWSGAPPPHRSPQAARSAGSRGRREECEGGGRSARAGAVTGREGRTPRTCRRC